MKPMLTIDELITHMEKKGIRFTIVSKEEAANFLAHNNYYMKLASYRRNYDKCPPESKRAGQYQNLEFAYLQELSTIDMHLRYLVLQMCLDIEHFLKVRLLTACTNNPQEDGYKIISEYLAKEDPNRWMLKNIQKHKSGQYCRDLIEKYYLNFPIWVLVELVPFGDLIHIIQFYDLTYHDNILMSSKYINTIRDLRNACAHSNCLLNQMAKPLDETKQPDAKVTSFIKQFHSVSSRTRAKYLNLAFPYSIVTLLFVYDNYAPPVSKCRRYKEIDDFLHSRVVRHKEYFASNPKICGIYHFFEMVIDGLLKRC